MTGSPSDTPWEPRNWSRVRDALERYLALESRAERHSFLDETFKDEPALRDEVERLAAAAESDPEFLSEPLASVSGASPHAAEASEFDGYRLIRPIGRGGMGEVYLAVRTGDDFERHVAIKVIRRGLDTEDVLERFRAERRILASLAHPNVAGLLDGGATPEGRPYFVMERVEGEPLDVFCDRNLLGVDERLRLFVRVCSAVHHAHQNLIVHRDLKPSNVLVTEAGDPKLLDFGIAKLLDAGDDEHTRAELRVLTPDYAAPEHLAGKPVTTASDVYSLGVVLYELLTGRRPFDGVARSSASASAVHVGTPTRPSEAVAALHTRKLEDGSTETLTPEHVSMLRSDAPARLRRRLAGDLDTIVLRALSPEPERRYGSAAALSDDIERHLAGRPVVARPDTFGYRMSTFVRRNRLAVTAAAAFVMLLVGSTVLAVAQARRVAVQADLVRSERDKAVEVRSFLLETFGAAGADVAADSLTAGALLDGRLATLDEEFGGRPSTLAEMQAVLAEGYLRLGSYSRADSLARASLQQREETLGPDHPDVASSLNTLGLVLHESGRSRDAEPLIQRAVDVWSGDVRERTDELARALNDLGLVREALADYDGAGEAYQASLSRRREAGQPPGRGMAITTSNLAALRYSQGQYDEAVALGSQALELLRTTVGPDHQRALVAQNNLAIMRQTAGDMTGAAEEYQDILDRRIRVLGAAHPDVAGSRRTLASLLLSTGKPAEAEPHLRAALQASYDVTPRGSPQAAATLGFLATAMAGQGQMEEATILNDSALAMQRLIHPLGHPDVATQANRSALHLRRLGDVAAALELHAEAIGIARRDLGAEHAQTAAYVSNMARTLLDSGRAEEAVPQLEEALGVLTAALGPEHDVTFGGVVLLAIAYGEAGMWEQSDSILTKARRELSAAPDSARGVRLDQAERRLARAR